LTGFFIVQMSKGSIKETGTMSRARLFLIVLAVRCSLLAVRCSLFADRCSLLAVRCSLFAARCSLLAALLAQLC
jgi:hypothetical protein